eukprot:IDg19355t1
MLCEREPVLFIWLALKLAEIYHRNIAHATELLSTYETRKPEFTTAFRVSIWYADVVHNVNRVHIASLCLLEVIDAVHIRECSVSDIVSDRRRQSLSILSQLPPYFSANDCALHSITVNGETHPASRMLCTFSLGAMA